MESDVTNGENGVTKDKGVAAKEKSDVAKEQGAVANNENAAVQEESAETENESVGTEDQSAEVEEEGIGDKDWYVIHVYSGFENKVKMSLEERFAHSGLTDKLGQIIIPTEEVVEIRGGKKKISSRKFYPGYVLISVDMDQDIWYLIKNTPKVTGFPGGATPVPLTATEVKDVMDQIKGEAKTPKPKFIFEKGENVRVIEGPFMNFNGVVEEVNPDKGKVKVMVSIFGRATPVELEFPQIERV
jgi:transcriptional antiterminator NusG